MASLFSWEFSQLSAENLFPNKHTKTGCLNKYIKSDMFS